MAANLTLPVTVVSKMYMSGDQKTSESNAAQLVFLPVPKFTLPKPPSISHKSLSLFASYSCNTSTIATFLFCSASISGVIPCLLVCMGTEEYVHNVYVAVCGFEVEGG